MTLFSTPDMRRTLNWRGTSLNAGILYVPGPLVSCRPGGLIHACSLSPRTSSSVVHLRLRGRSREVAAGRGRSGECDQAAAPAHALRKGALDLADVERRVDRRAEVDEQVGAAHLVVAREHVDLHLDAADALGEVVEGEAARALVRRAVGLDAGSSVPVEPAAPLLVDDEEAVRRQVDPAQPRFERELREARVGPQLGVPNGFIV